MPSIRHLFLLNSRSNIFFLILENKLKHMFFQCQNILSPGKNNKLARRSVSIYFCMFTTSHTQNYSFFPYLITKILNKLDEARGQFILFLNNNIGPTQKYKFWLLVGQILFILDMCISVIFHFFSDLAEIQKCDFSKSDGT